MRHSIAISFDKDAIIAVSEVFSNYVLLLITFSWIEKQEAKFGAPNVTEAT